MRLKLLFSIVALLFSSTSWGQKDPLIIDKIVAQVGDNIILLSDVQAQKLQMIQAEQQVDKNSDCDLLEQMMVQNLMLNQAKLDSVEISDAQVDAEMENRLRIIEQQIGGRQKLEEFYGKSVTQIKEEFRSIIKDRLLTQEMERQITADVNVTPKEVEKFFKALPKDSIPFISSKLSFQQIVYFPTVTKDDKLKAFNSLAEIRKDIEAGKSFETQARIHSMDPGSKGEGGKIEATRGMMVPQFEAALFSLKEGEMSDVFETEYGYHIVKLISRKGEDYVVRHILIVPEYNYTELEKAASLMDSCYAKLRQNELTWDQAVIRYSNDDRTKQNKGIITNPISGDQNWSMEDLNQVDQQIFVLTDALDKGEITQPALYFDIYERKQGIRIVRLMERTDPHVANLTQDYPLIKRATENAKKNDIISAWVDDKIGKAFVNIDPEFNTCTFKYSWDN